MQNTYLVKYERLNRNLKPPKVENVEEYLETLEEVHIKYSKLASLIFWFDVFKHVDGEYIEVTDWRDSLDTQTYLKYSTPC
jgi:hypothetical protein